MQRSEGVQLFRDGSFILCQAFANGAMNGDAPVEEEIKAELTKNRANEAPSSSKWIQLQSFELAAARAKSLADSTTLRLLGKVAETNRGQQAGTTSLGGLTAK